MYRAVFAFKQGSRLKKRKKTTPKKKNTQTQILKKQPLPTQGMFIRVQFPLELLMRRMSKVIMLNFTD